MAKQLRGNFHYAFLLSRILGTKITGNDLFITRSRPPESLSIWKRFNSQDDHPNIVHSPLGEIHIPDNLLHESVIEYSSVYDKRMAIKCARSGRKYTFRQMRNLSKILAAAFQNKLKLSKGDIVATILRNCPEYPLIFLAVSQSGTVMTTVNPLYTPFEIVTQLGSVRPKIIICDLEFYQKSAGIAKDLNMTTPIVVLKGKRSDPIPSGAVDLFELFDQRRAGTFTPVNISSQDTLVIPFSSGTSGTPKGVVLSHKNLVSNLVQLSHPDTTILYAPTLFRKNAVLGVLPMCHIFGLVVMTFFTIKEGGSLITLPTFEPREFVKTIYWQKISVIYAVPPLISFLTNKAIRPRYMKRVQYIVNGASRYSTKDAAIIMGRNEQIKMVQGYGMTESSPVLAHTFSKRMQKLSSIGVPIASTRLKVVSLETGEILPARKEGELYAAGPQIMKGYFEKPEETERVLDKCGWLKTGDLAYYDEDGDFYIVDRVKELIKVSGFQVAPAELEETLKIHPKIKDAVVVGVPDGKTGEAPKAFIITESKDALTVEDVHKYMAEKLSAYKQLKGGVVFVDEFPKSHTGKVLRMQLKQK